MWSGHTQGTPPENLTKRQSFGDLVDLGRHGWTIVTEIRVDAHLKPARSHSLRPTSDCFGGRLSNFHKTKKSAAVLKHAIIDQYATPFASKTGSTSLDHRVAFIDGYAGPGRYEDGEEGSGAKLLRKAKELAPSPDRSNATLWRRTRRPRHNSARWPLRRALTLSTRATRAASRRTSPSCWSRPRGSRCSRTWTRAG